MTVFGTINTAREIGALFAQTADKTVANTGTETSLIGTGQGSVTLPADFFSVGKTIRFRWLGYNSTTSPAGTLIFRVKLGASTIMATATNTATNNLANNRVEIFGEITCRSVGASGTVHGQGSVIRATAANAASRWQMVKTSTSTVDTTGSLLFDITVQWGTASASNTMTMTNGILEVFR